MNEREGFPTLPESQGHWRWLLLLGMGLILFGAVELGSVAFMEFLAVVVVGPLLMASGILQVLLAFFASHRREAPLHLTAAALDLAVGFLVIIQPHATEDDLILVLAAFLMVGGVGRILSSLFYRFRAWGWLLAAGLVAVSLGMFVWKQGHFRSLPLVLACVAIDFISHGVSWVVLSHSARSARPDASKGGPI